MTEKIINLLKRWPLPDVIEVREDRLYYGFVQVRESAKLSELSATLHEIY